MKKIESIRLVLTLYGCTEDPSAMISEGNNEQGELETENIETQKDTDKQSKPTEKLTIRKNIKQSL
ncbi:hypothetical protein [Marinilactibacillus psychrotolerans]|uniref:hypothetical protein n=1 Tax=Marinilactibacillus psychrotolerans TaxID=191770 RepID=UPI001867CE0E|nr:hypothetical protein [Marinilactibacillus psychrotolerans]